MQLVGRIWEDSEVIAAGVSLVVVLPAAARFSVAAFPGASGTATAEYTLSPWAAIEAGTARWLPLITAAAAATDVDHTAPARALRLTAATAAATFDILQWHAD